MRFVLGTVNHIDPRQKVVTWAGPEGAANQVGYDRLILTAGSANKLLPIPGIADYAHGSEAAAAIAAWAIKTLTRAIRTTARPGQARTRRPCLQINPICVAVSLLDVSSTAAHSGGYVCGWPRRLDHAP